MINSRVLLIDDNDRLRHLMRDALALDGLEVYTAADGRQGVQQVAAVAPDLVLLDMRMPEMDGIETLQRIRHISHVPVIFLSGANGDRRAAQRLNLDAVDYIDKPFSLPLLQSRVRAALGDGEPAAPATPPPMQLDPQLALDLARQRLLVGGRQVPLTETELKLLCLLLENRGCVLTHQEIQRQVWGWEGNDAAVVHVYISRLRQKMGENGRAPRHLVSVHGVGYRLRAASDSLVAA